MKSENNPVDITVIIPSLPERAPFLEEAIASVKNQTLEGAQIIFGVDVNRIGAAATRNALVEQAETEWILFLDDDDFLDPKYLENVVPYFDEADMIYTWCDQIGMDIGLDIEFNPDLLRSGNYIPVTACVRRNMFNEVGGFHPDAIYEDWGLWLKLLDAGARIKPIYKKLWTYRRHAGSMTFVNQHKVASGMSATGY